MSDNWTFGFDAETLEYWADNGDGIRVYCEDETRLRSWIF